MDKRVIFAVAGSGKTTYIINSLKKDERALIVTYTLGNYNNLLNKIANMFNGELPANIEVMTYFTFLYRFCYKPFLADEIKAKGITYERNTNKYIGQDKIQYYLSNGRYIYSNRLSLLIEKCKYLPEVKQRLEKYFDRFIIDEVQDIAGRDFNFLEELMTTNISMLFVGDFYQHTYDTSSDGNTNKNLFSDQAKYIQRFIDKGFICDRTTLTKSWRCSEGICKFITEKLGIPISSNLPYDSNSADFDVVHITDQVTINSILNDERIIKLHLRESAKFGTGHKNWGETKGEDHYNDVCVLLNKTTAKLYLSGKLCDLPPSTRNKLYVALTRAHGKVYLVDE